MSNIRTLDNKGFSHHFLLPVLVIMLIAAAGTYVLQKSRAGVAYTNGPIYTGNSFVRPDGSKEEQAGYYNLDTPEDGYLHDVVFSPDGSRVAYVQTKYSEGKSVIKTARSNGTDVKELHRFDGGPDEAGNGISRPTWSSDSKYIAFTYGNRGVGLYANGGGNIITVRSDGNTTDEDAYRLIPAYPEAAEYGFSESGIQFVPGTQKITYIINTYQGEQYELINQLCTVELDTEAEPMCTTLSGMDTTQGGYPSNFRVSNKGVGLFVTRQYRVGTEPEYDEQFYRINLSTAKVQAVGPSRHLRWYNHNPGIEWSPDGNYIAYKHHYQTALDPSLAGTFVMDYYGQNAEKISNESGSSELAWQPVPIGGSQSPLPTDRRNVSCIIEGPIGGKFTVNKPNQIRVTLTNNSIGNVSTSVEGAYTIQNVATQEYDIPPTTVQIPVGSSKQIDIPTAVIPYAEYESASVLVNINVEIGTNCNTQLALPHPPLSLSGRLNRTVPYAKEFVVGGSTLANRNVSLHNESTSVTQDWSESNEQGIFSLSTSTRRESTSYAVVLDGSFKSPVLTAKTRAVVNGKTVATIKKGKKAFVTGKYIPNKSLTIFVRRPGDQPGKFPTRITVRTDANGNFSRSFDVNKRMDYYVQTPNGAITPTYTVKEN